MNKTIVVPLDGSPLAEQALPYAAAIALGTQSDLLLLSAIVPIETWLEAGGVYTSDKRWQEEAEAAAAYLQDQCASIDGKGLTCRAAVMWGKSADCIRAAAADGDSLIVMTTHGRSGLPRLVIGSVASEVVRTAAQPVFLVPASEQSVQEATIKRILVSVDGSSMSEAVLPVAGVLAKALDAEIVLERVVTPPGLLYGSSLIPSAGPALDKIEEEAKEYVERLAVSVRHHGHKVQSDVSVGEASDSIIEAADRLDADVIAMSSHGRTGLARLLMGSVADSVIRSARRPVLLVRPAPVVEAQLPEQPPAGIEVIEGVSVAPVLVPPPELTESPAGDSPRGRAPAERPHRPERRSMA